MSKARKLALFRKGAGAIERLGGPPGVYVCPICGDAYEMEALVDGTLTLEHVPPDSGGGLPLVLTCRSCNSSAGHTLDVSFDGRRRLRNLGASLKEGTPNPPEPVELDFGVGKLRATLTTVEQGHKIELVDKANDPAALQRQWDHLRGIVDSGNWEGKEFSLTYEHKYHPRHFKLSVLRTAFLLVFARAGYRWAFDQRLAWVRRQILDANVDGETPFWMVPKQPLGDVILTVGEPFSMLVVTLLGGGAILPWRDSPVDFYERLKADYEPGAQIALTGTPVPWPSRMLLAGDDEPGGRLVFESRGGKP